MATVNFDAVQQVLVAHDATWAVGVAMVLIFAALNWFGIKAFARVEIVLTVCMWLTLMIFGICGLLQPTTAGPQGSSALRRWATDAYAVMSLVGMAMFMFLGIEFVTPLAPRAAQRAAQHAARDGARPGAGVAVHGDLGRRDGAAGAEHGGRPTARCTCSRRPTRFRSSRWR